MSVDTEALSLLVLNWTFPFLIIGWNPFTAPIQIQLNKHTNKSWWNDSWWEGGGSLFVHWLLRGWLLPVLGGWPEVSLRDDAYLM